MRASVWCVAAVTAATGGGVAAQELYRQDPFATIGGLSSQDARNPGGLGWFSEVIDNFPVEVPQTISAVEFWGGYGPNPPGTFRGCTIRFYADNAGAPGARLFERDVLGTCGETPDFTSGGGSRYHYSAALSPGFSPPSAGRYWVSVVGIVDRGGGSTDPQWGWIPATEVSPPAAVQFVFGTQIALSDDVAFVLDGSVCYANCDFSSEPPALNVLDFNCFLNRFTSGDSYANCDGSTAEPVLNVLDFNCFLNRFTTGCP
jgi:hypothetical protein